MRTEPPTTVGEKAVTGLFDRRDPDGPFGPIQSSTDDASRDVLVWHLDNDARIVLRPSGTEPKSKLYVEVSGQPDADLHSEIARVTADCHALAEQFSLQMLAAVGIDLPAWALEISGLVSVENKARFAQEILPALVQRIASPEPDEGIGEWLDVALSPCGDDARDLFAPGVEAFIKAENPANSATLLACFTR